MGWIGSGYVGLGVSYTLRTPWLWKMVFCPLILSALASLVILIVLLAAAYAPQARALAKTSLPSGWAWFFAFFFVLIEAALLTIILFLIVYGQLQQRVFDKVYEAKASEAAKASMEENSEVCCGECKGCGWLMVVKLALAIVTMPLNVIPIIGNFCFAWINGFFYAWDLHRDYFAAHGLVGYKEQYALCKKDGFYTGFGTIALFAETVPLFGVFFMITNAAGAALYAAEKEPVLKHLQKVNANNGVEAVQQQQGESVSRV